MRKSLIKVAVIVLIVSALIGISGCETVSEILSPAQSNAPEEPAAPVTSNGNGTTLIDGQTKPSTEPAAPITLITLPNIADVVAAVKPSVVAINTEVTTLDFFNRPSSEKGAGSGWIIREDGLIVTNNHVVENANAISVTLDDGRTFPVDLKTVATDPLTDLAIFKIDAAGLPAAKVGDSSKMRIGDWVIAIGNSLGEGTRATQGIISRQNASIVVDQTQSLYGLIETDAAINPGNSGGPLVNLAGEVIGINSAKLAAVGVEATGFAISTEAAMPLIDQLITAGRVAHPWLGVSLFPVDPVIVQTYNLSVNNGAMVVEVSSGSPAALGGIQPKDVIVEFGGAETRTAEKLIQEIRRARVGQTVKVVYWRGAEMKTAEVTLGERPRQ